MPMAVPQSQPQSEPDDMGVEIERVLRAAVAAERPRPRPVAALPPASSEAGAGGELWGPSTPRPIRGSVQSPLELLAEVAQGAASLQVQLAGLVTKITGEQPTPRRIQQVPRRTGGLLPAISLLAHQIDEAHGDLARLIAHVERQL